MGTNFGSDVYKSGKVAAAREAPIIGCRSIADKYRNAIRNMPNISNLKFDVEIVFMAGSLSAKYSLPLPDMLQVASALAQPANAIITNDRDIQPVLIERFGDMITDCE